MSCKVCLSPALERIYQSSGSLALTSLCQAVQTQVEVFFCGRCGHLQTPELPNLADYYAHDYEITLNSEEEDQIYATEGETITYRFDHQVRVLRDKLPLKTGDRILDFGCAKSATMKKLAALRPDLDIYLFDVSDMYLTLWHQFIPPEHGATFEVPAAWQARFDCVTSFFALEHAADPRAFMHQIHGLLAPEGRVHLLVPNVLANTADMIVADHVHHFTHASLHALFQLTGFEQIEIDSQSHRGVWVVSAQRASAVPTTVVPPCPAELASQVREIAHFWHTLAERIQAMEAAHPDAKVAIYGAGFYGSLITACLQHPERVVAYLDRNQHMQGRQHMQRPILAPEALPSSISLVYVGLNPQIARQAIAEISVWQSQSRQFFYL